MATFEEIPGRREVGFEPPTVTTVWVCEDEFSSNDVATAALTAIPLFALHPWGTLYRQAMMVNEIGANLHEVTVPYGLQIREILSGAYSVEVGPCQVPLKARVGKHINVYPSGFPTHGGLIEVHGGVVHGYDHALDATKVSVHYTHPAGVIDEARINVLARLRGSVDSGGFFGRPAYETYFLDWEGHWGSDVQTTISYHFAVRENQTGLTVGSITGIDVAGFDIPWASWKPVVVGGRPGREIEYVNVVRIPKERDLATELGFG